jgi:hypothetical protein
MAKPVKGTEAHGHYVAKAARTKSKSKKTTNSHFHHISHAHHSHTKTASAKSRSKRSESKQSKAKVIARPNPAHQPNSNVNSMTEQQGRFTLVKADRLYTNALKLGVTDDMADRDLNLSSKAVKASIYATIHALNKSKKKCAAYVRQALNSQGIDIGRSQYAKDYGKGLVQAGFSPVNISPNRAKAGDVVIFQAVPGHRSGHMAIYNGKNWVSDFNQKSFYVANGYTKGKYTIYRKP